jgi:hypothetical protein
LELAMLTTILNTLNLVVLTLALSWIGNLTTPVVGRALRAGQDNVLTSWRELRLSALARRVIRLERIQLKPALALADMIMAMFVAMIGGGYAITIIVVGIYLRVGHPASRPDVSLFLGGVALVYAGIYRAIDSHSDLLQTDKKLAKLRAKAATRGWDLDDACVALR